MKTTTSGGQELLTLACDGVGDLVLVAGVQDGELTCVAANRAARDRLGRDVEPDGVAVRELLGSAGARAFEAAASAALANDGAVDYDDEVRLGGGPVFSAGVRVQPVGETADGRLVSWVARGRPVATLSAQRDGRAAGTLRRENVALQQANIDLEQFAYTASHDLAEPLRMITAYLELLSVRYAAELDDQARRYIAFAVDGATRMRALIDDLLALARLGGAAGPMDDVDLGSVAGDVRADLDAVAREVGATIVVEAMPTVVGDRPQLTRLLANLLSNALKFRGESAPEVVVAAAREAGWWRITVADNGIGIAPEFQAQVFDMFRRLHPRSAYPGTGMGLAISRKIVERHAGEIGVESEPGSGTRFWFTLPCAPTDVGSAAPYETSDDAH